MFKKNGDGLCYDKLMMFEKRIFRAARALNGILENSIGGNYSANINETLNLKGQAFYKMLIQECSGDKCLEALDGILGSMNGKSGNMNGCDIPTMLVEQGEFDADTQVHEVCNRATVTLRSGQIINLINNGILASSAYMVFQNPDSQV